MEKSGISLDLKNKNLQKDAVIEDKKIEIKCDEIFKI
jgi:hypothetical protein